MKYSKELTERLCKHLKQGSSIKSACAAAGISRETFHQWKKTKPDFSDTVDRAMAIPDRKVENTLYKTAKGFRYTETEYKAIANKDHTKIAHIPIKKVRKMVLPSVAAQKFILTNRNPEEWRDKQDLDVSGDMSITVISAVPRSKNKENKKDAAAEPKQ